MKKLLFLSTLIVTLFSSVEACSPPLETPDHLKESDLVFVGEVVQAGKFKSDMSTMGIDLLVLFTIKGEDVSKMRLRTPASSAACGYDSGKTFEPGSYWLMHAKHDGEVYHTTHLSGNQMFEDMGAAVVEAESLLAESFLYATLTETIEEETTSTVLNVEELPPLDDISLEDVWPEDIPEIADMPPMVVNECKVEFDGCNTCVHDEVTGEANCSQNECSIMPLDLPVCLLYFQEMENFLNKGAFYKSDIEMVPADDLPPLGDYPEDEQWDEEPDYGYYPADDMGWDEPVVDLPEMIDPAEFVAPNIGVIEQPLDYLPPEELPAELPEARPRVPRSITAEPVELPIMEEVDLSVPLPPEMLPAENMPPADEQSLYEEEHRLRYLMTSLFFWQ